MIESLRFHSGYPSRLEGIGRRLHRFGDRINVLFGPNGSGKTTMLHALAVATGCGNGGWSDRERIGDERSSCDRRGRGCSAQRTAGELGFRASLEWDGYPVFYQDCYAHSEKSFIGSGYLESRKMLRSTGEKRIGLINELIDYLENRFLTYKLKADQRPTLLLDEVDNHVGFAGQSILWKEIFPLLSKKYQLIVATHSIFPVLLRKNTTSRKDNILELTPQYAARCLGELGEAIEFFNESGGSV